MDSYAILISDSAHNDLDSIDNYYHLTLKEPETAANVIEQLYTAIESLSTFPERHMMIDSLFAGINMRAFVVGNYLIFYLIHENTVNIIRVLHHRRNWQELF